MYDTVNLRLLQSEVGKVDFLSEIPCHLTNIWESYPKDNDSVTIAGNLNNLKVSVNRRQMKIKDGSLCKWYLGDNFKTMGRGDVQRAIEKLSDILHLPISKATITRFDIAQNFITRYPTEVYLNHLGELRYATRLQEPDGIYYNQTWGRLCFYDKNKEQRAKNEPIPELYKGRNVFRYEQRYLKRIAQHLNVEKVTGAMLYDEQFYIKVLNNWRDNYKSIQKINDVTLNFAEVKTKQQLNKMGVLSLVELMGGQVKMIEQITNAQKRGELTKKQAFDLRQAIKDAYQLKEGITVKSDAIAELDKKIDEAIKFYR